MVCLFMPSGMYKICVSLNIREVLHIKTVGERYEEIKMRKRKMTNIIYLSYYTVWQDFF